MKQGVMMNKLTIGQLAKLTGNTIVTIRYYEKLGLLGDIKRSEGGFRIYTESLLPLFHFIKNAKFVGFDLTEVKELIDLQKNLSTSATVKKKTKNKIDDIDQKIKTLTKMKNALTKWEKACDGKVSIDKCPILSNLYSSSIIKE